MLLLAAVYTTPPLSYVDCDGTKRADTVELVGFIGGGCFGTAELVLGSFALYASMQCFLFALPLALKY